MGVGAAVAGGLASAAAGAALDDGEGGAGGSRPTRVQQYTPEQMDILKKLSGQVEPQIGEGVEAYPFETVPGAHPLQEQMGALAGDADTQLMQSLRRSGRLLEPEEWEPERVEERWSEAVMQPARRSFMEDTAPRMMEEFAGRGAMRGSGMENALSREARRFEQEGQSKLADMMFQSWQEHQNRELQRSQLGSSMLGQTLGQMGQLGELGQQLRSVEGERGQERLQKWQMEQSYRNPWLNQLSQVLGAQPYAVTQTQQAPSMQHQLGQGLVGGGMNIASAGVQAGLMGS